MFPRFFVRRPVFSWVIVILLMLAGIMAIRTLPFAKHPDAASPYYSLKATYSASYPHSL